MTTGWVWHERYMWHDTGSAAGFIPAGGYVEPDVHVESPAAKRRLRNLVAVSGLEAELVPIEPRRATREELSQVHTGDYLDFLEAMSERGGGDAGGPERSGPDREPSPSPFGPGGFEIACLAAGGCLAAVEAVVKGTVENAYALVRPPGHHAQADRGMGTCLLNNVAAAAHRAMALGCARVAIVDWDVHHGNGTQEAFWEDGGVLFISIHQAGCFPPDSGQLREIGQGPGAGTTLNVPLPPGSGEGAYAATMDRVAGPALRRFSPDLILVSCGLDASAMDPLGRQLLHSEAFRRMTAAMMQAADEACDGRLVLCHEGGYSPAYAPFCGLAVIEELAGTRTAVDDPFLPVWSGVGYQGLQPHQEEVAAAAARLVDRVPPP